MYEFWTKNNETYTSGFILTNDSTITINYYYTDCKNLQVVLNTEIRVIKLYPNNWNGTKF